MEGLGRVVIGSAVGGLLGAAAFFAVEAQSTKAMDAPAFPSFAALSDGKDCRIVLDFPDGDFCGTTVAADGVRGWYYGQNKSSGLTQRYDFTVFANTDEGVKKIPVRFLNSGTAKRFYMQMGVWSGKQSTHGGDSPFAEWLDPAR